ncbi:MAG TPA: tetratricopeptide repeat protein [Gemmataceae bacterium]|nr:tetratricopeptide repeat protein [Gemmataceae bacterium]
MPNDSPKRVAVGLALFALVAAVGGAAAWFAFLRPEPAPQPEPDVVAADPPTADPRVSFDTPFRNVKPAVRYLGDASCAGCHGDIDKKYHAHPMGRSAALVARASPLETYAPGPHNPFTVGPLALRAEKTPDKVLHHVAAKGLADYTVTADIAIGSGTRGRSYLSVEDGSVWQSPVSWFSPDARWNLSPGFDMGTGGRRAIVPECLFCHVDRVERVAGSVNRYREPLLVGQAAISCERCHGPGELHVAERAGPKPPGIDTSIVNPKHLPADLRQSVCAQCHLQGQERVARRGRDLSEFRPGLPLDLFVTTFVKHPDLADAHRSVGQFEQIERSRCNTGGKLLCTSCHDPHEKPAPANRDAYFRQRCLTCHESKGCSLPQPERAAKNDSCVACHMPRFESSSIVHASVTDHTIARRPGAPEPPGALLPGTAPLVAFRAGPHAPPQAERDRDLGIALARLAGRSPVGPRHAVGALAADRLTQSLQTWRGDAPAWVALATARGARGEFRDRLDAATAAAKLAPESDLALGELAEAAALANRLDAALDAANTLVGRNPRSVEFLLLRAVVFQRQKEWEKAEADCRAALRIHPLHPQARLYLALCRHRRGDPADGRRELDAAVQLATTQRQKDGLRDWYDREAK